MEAVVDRKYALVALDAAVGKELEYAVPESLRGKLRVGSRVEVPLGKGNHECWGYIVGFTDTPKFDPAQIKAIISEPLSNLVIPDELMRLGRWIADYYCTPLDTVLKTVVPAAIRKPSAGPKYLTYVRKNAAVEQLRQACVKMRKRSLKQAQVLEIMLQKHGDVLLSELCKEAGAVPSTVKALAKKKLLKISRKEHYRNFLKEDVFLKVAHKKLNQDQRRVYDELCQAFDAEKFHVTLLHGITGSGKTEVYLQLIDHALQRGKSAIVLVPEIALTPQAIERFKSRFSEEIAVLHHRLSAGERHDEWHRISAGKARIAIGPRSAIFAPVKKLGVIVVDEEHDGSYKQQELQPPYNARDMAVVRGMHEKALVVLGSATPSLESYYNTINGKYRLAKLPARIDNRPLPQVRIIDMRRERSENNRFIVLSDPLLNAINDRIKNGEQVILFLNRRGYANFVICRGCGEVVKCDHCSISMKYHREKDKMMCHICGYTRPMMATCNACRQGTLTYRGIGTERIEKMLYAVLKDARVLRMDSDTTRKKRSHSRILNDFRRCKADILLGTQMVAKGLDFPNVTLVGILDADVALHLQDFRAAEHTFQIITQVAGRAGRGEIPGEVYIQTLTPNHPAIIAAGKQDYEKFYRQEIGFRTELGYPPLTHMVKIEIQDKEESAAREGAMKTVSALKKNIPPTVELLGPAPAPIARSKGRYRYQLFLKSENVSSLSSLLKSYSGELKLKSTTRISLDVDPISLL